MSASLTTFTRVISMTGKSGAVASLTDNLWFAPGTGSGTYTTLGSDPALSIPASNDKVMMLAAVPLAAYWDDALYPATQVTVEWTQSCVANGGIDGGVYFQHYSGGEYASTGRGYYFAAGYNAGQFCYTVSYHDGSFHTIVASTDFAAANDTKIKFRATLSKGSTTVDLLVKWWDGAAWATVYSGTNLTSAGISQFGVAFRASQRDLVVSNISVTFQAAAAVVCFMGQSELTGQADTAQVQASDNLLVLNRSTGAIARCTDTVGGISWTRSLSANANWPSVIADNAAGPGSFIPNLAKLLNGTYSTVVGLPFAVKNSSRARDYVPSSTARYPLTGTTQNTHADGSGDDTFYRFTGPAFLALNMLAGDGQTTGQLAAICIYHTTGDQSTYGWVGSTTAVNYQGCWQSVLTRALSLFPTTICRIAKMGDRSWRFPESDAITAQTEQRTAVANLISGNANALLWFDESDITGSVGSGLGWPQLDTDGYHPATQANRWLSVAGAWNLDALLVAAITEQVTADRAAVTAAKAGVSTATTIVGITGTMPTTATTQAADAATLTGTTLNANGTDTTVAFGASNGTAKSGAVYTAGQAAKAAADAAEADGNKAKIIKGQKAIAAQSQEGTFTGVVEADGTTKTLAATDSSPFIAGDAARLATDKAVIIADQANIRKDHAIPIADPPTGADRGTLEVGVTESFLVISGGVDFS